MTDKITFFASGCGDSVFLEADDKLIMTDINYRTSKVGKDGEDAPDFAPEIRKACQKKDDHLDLFVLTHPDKDHLSGFNELFHLGDPDDWEEYPDEGETLIIVDEIWCSPYAIDPNYTTDASEPVLDEISRRNDLIGTAEGDKAGNRLKVLDTENNASGNFSDKIQWRVLAPTPDEADIPKSDDEDNPNSCNDSSLVIRWAITKGWKENLILLGGDATVDVWDRIYDDYYSSDRDALSWHILLAPHHCSRRAIGRVENEGTDDEKYVLSKDKAIKAIGQKQGDGAIVASSDRIKREQSKYQAKQEYLKILAGDGEVNDSVRKRFSCTGGDADKTKADHVVFNLTSAGPSKKALTAASILGGSSSASGRGGGYG